MEKVITEIDDQVFIITINRPEVKNCIDGETADLLSRAWKRFRDDDNLYVAILTGRGEDSFCSGADLKNVETLGPGREASDEEVQDFIERGPGFIGYTRQTDIFKPILAAVNGYALAGGLELACLADIRIASAKATFGVTCRRYNVPLVDGGTQRLPRIIGMGAAMDLIITGRIIDAGEAMTLGLVNEVVPAGKSLERCRTLAHEIARLPQSALRADKKSAILGYGRPLEEGLRMEAQNGYPLLYKREMEEGLERFRHRKSEKDSE